MEQLQPFIGLAVSSVIALAVAYFTAKFAARNELTKLKEERKLDYSIESVITHLLENPNYKKRRLLKIKRHLRGFKDDDELRMALMRAGAVAFSGEDDKEMWGLLRRNEKDIK